MEVEQTDQNNLANHKTNFKEQHLLSEETISALVNLGEVLHRIHMRLRREGMAIDIAEKIKDHESGNCQN